jgi:membrane-associated phospholipid phosphatase
MMKKRFWQVWNDRIFNQHPVIFWRNLALMFGLASLVLLYFFRAFPAWDIGFAARFYDPSLCAHTTEYCIPFFGEHNPFLRFWQRSFEMLMRGIGLVIILASLVYLGLIARDRWKGKAVGLTKSARLVLGALVGLVLAPAALVNWILKAYWGRPRPRHTDVFGGEHPFVLAGTETDYCLSNCSFVSGEGSGIFWVFALLPLVALHFGKRVAWVVGLIWTVIATSVAMNRAVFGAHYLSDVVLSATFTLALVAVGHWLLQRSWR